MLWWIGGLLVATAALTVVIFHVQQSWDLVFKLGHPPKNAGRSLASIPYKTHTFTFSSSDGLPLAAVQYFPEGESKGTVIACHYLGGGKQAIYAYIEPLLEAGYMVAAFDYPNHGDSGSRKSGRYTLEGDLRRFLTQLRRRGGAGPYAAVGFSMGATLALGAADLLPDLKAVVLDSGPLLYVKDYFVYVLNNKKIRNRLTRLSFLFIYLVLIGFFRMARRTKKRLKRLKGFPILFIHGERDNVIPLRNAQAAYELVKSDNSRFLQVKRSHHMTNRALLGEAYDKQVVGFIDRWLSGEKTDE